MEIFRELTIKSKNRENLVSLLNYLIDTPPKNWTHRDDLVRNYRSHNLIEENQIACILSPQIYTENRTIQGLIWLLLKEDCISLMNVVPPEVGSLSKREYNTIVMHFATGILKPLSEKIDFDFFVTDSAKSIEELAGIDVANKLIKFSRSANKSTGYSNPHDLPRWLDFINTAHNNKSELSLEDLERFLEGDGWEDDSIITELILGYEYGLDILEYYDSNN